MKQKNILLQGLLLFFLALCLIGSACDNGNPSNTGYPSLKVVNQYAGVYISSVALVGYEFNTLNITSGNSQTFILANGMLGGYTALNIHVVYRSGPSYGNINNKFDFVNGKTTIITLKGSSDYGTPYYNNPKLE
jgi:hypothetical protein